MLTTISRGHSDLPDCNSVLGEDLLYYELANMFGKLPPSGRNHGNKQYPIAKTRKDNSAQKHMFIYLNN